MTLVLFLDMEDVFIGQEKAFDRIPREEIWRMLEERWVDKHLNKAFKTLYRQCRNNVRIRSIKREEFLTEQGLRQASVTVQNNCLRIKAIIN